MNIEIVRAILGWCAIINYGVLLLWFLLFMLGHDWLHGVHGRWFRVTVEQFDTTHYAGMGLYKLGIMLFNLAPYAAIMLVS